MAIIRRFTISYYDGVECYQPQNYSVVYDRPCQRGEVAPSSELFQKVAAKQQGDIFYLGTKKYRLDKLESELTSEELMLEKLREAERRAIQEIVSRRKITRLVHFTQSKNVGSILKHGILSRK